jgi:hypothetical protein
MANHYYLLTKTFLTGAVTPRRIDDVEPGVESTIQQFAYRGEGCSLIADLRAAKAENTNIHIGLAKPACPATAGQALQ